MQEFEVFSGPTEAQDRCAPAGIRVKQIGVCPARREENLRRVNGCVRSLRVTSSLLAVACCSVSACGGESNATEAEQNTPQAMDSEASADTEPSTSMMGTMMNEEPETTTDVGLEPPPDEPDLDVDPPEPTTAEDTEEPAEQPTAPEEPEAPPQQNEEDPTETETEDPETPQEEPEVMVEDPEDPEDPIPEDPEELFPLAPPPGEYGTLEELPFANSEMAVAEAGGYIYVLGGYPSSREVQTTVQRYDPSTDGWDVVEPLPTPLHHPVIVGVGALLYSAGGQVSQGGDPDTDRTLVYDPDADSWTELAPMPTARGAGAGAVIDDKFYVVGGRPPAGNAFEVYDIGDDAWEILPNLPTDINERNHLAATVIDGKLYVAGGRYDGGGFSSPMTDSLDIFDPATGEWTLGAPMLRPRGGVNGVAAYGCFHVFGGEGSGIGEPNDVFPDHDVYDPVTDTWMALPPLPVPVHGVTGAAFIDGVIFMPGGGTSSGGSSGSTFFQVFTPTTHCD